MLIEFRVKNFRSLRDEQVFSMVASKDATFQDTHTQPTGITAAPSLLRSAVIYGPNAGGKSNLIKALQYMRNVVLESATAIQPGQTFNVQPFRLDAESGNEPTEFEVTFIVDGTRYQYGFAMTPARIVSEHLLVYKAPKPQQWFSRRFDKQRDQDVYEFSAYLKGKKSLWESSTRPNSLFLSMATQLNSEQLRTVFGWFAQQLVIFNEQSQLNPGVSMLKMQNADKNEKKSIRDFLVAADISISEIELVTRKVTSQTMHFDAVAGKTEIRPNEFEQHELLFHHATERGKAAFSLAEESQGTRILFFLAGPVLDIVNKGQILIVDELDTSLHTMLVRQLIRRFNTASQGKSCPQLIFTTHDTSLLDAQGLFRRDQVWFIEKDRDQSSCLYSLTEFSPRKNEALEKGYLMGRYSGLPLLESLENPS